MRSALHIPYFAIRSAITFCCILLCLAFPTSGSAQADPLFETAEVEIRLAVKLKLTPKDRRLLRPLIEWESDDLLSLYEYYADQNAPIFTSLWDAVRSRRREIAVRSVRSLTPRQEKALSLARSEFEKQILELWFDDNLQILMDLLDLDWVQFKYVQRVFYMEHLGRLNVLRRELGNAIQLNSTWQWLGDERDRKLERIVSDSQLRLYRKLTTPPDLIARMYLDEELPRNGL